ncbi:Lysophospholipase L1 [Desulforamulus putei DSM 12395]|uniref:Lysophospholipase L1 n=1 Tax=Desulforamulus putei DSM 12395 TaxID=1121429 RepID=A0A1M4YQ18_9FIRM|nr:SGNH/GDSL hydrolase family protein [Desulforamulus putei]SHF07758.1 Lysophospholipase L1 [Desulforamulus putei DSM 12395]
MINVVQLDTSLLGLQERKGEQVMHAEDFGPPEASCEHRIRIVTGETCRVAEARGLKSLLIPVINARAEQISPEAAARLMVSEVRRYLSLGSDIEEVTFALPDEKGVEAFRRVAVRQKIVCLGDSITYGYPDGPPCSWVTVVAAATGYPFINRGISGETTGQMLARFERDVAAEEPAYVIFAGGHNDGWMGISLAEVQENIIAVVNRAFANGICPILVLPSPLNIRQMLQCYEGTQEEARRYFTRLEQIRQWIRQYAGERGLLTLDFHTPLLDGNSGQGDPRYLLDGGHPTHQGYRILGEAVIKQLAGRLHFSNALME